VAVINRHLERQAALRHCWSARRLYLMCAKTGSILLVVACRARGRRIAQTSTPPGPLPRRVVSREASKCVPRG
jgi:hypothetical protein